MQDPAGIAWEVYRNMKDVEYFNDTAIGEILVPIPQDDPEMSAVNETCASSLHGQFMPFYNGGGIINALAEGRYQAVSAGSNPSGEIHEKSFKHYDATD